MRGQSSSESARSQSAGALGLEPASAMEVERHAAGSDERERRDDLAHAKQIALHEEQLFQRPLRRAGIGAFRRDELLQELDTLAELIDDLEVVVHDRVEQRVKDQPGGREMALAESSLDLTSRVAFAVMHGDDRVPRHEDRHLVKANLA